MMRVEITTNDFRDCEQAKEKGWYREHYFCTFCGIELGHKTFDDCRQFGQGTVLHNNEFPNYCPNCGAKADKENNKTMLPTKREQMIECVDAIENSMIPLCEKRDMWQNNLIFWLCKAVLLLLEKEVRK